MECPIQYVSQKLGHENIAVTYKLYAHFLPGDDGGSADTWADVTCVNGEGFSGLPPAT